MNKGIVRSCAGAVAIVPLILLLLALPALAGKSKENKPAADTAKDPSQYVGSETCKGCHADIYEKGFEQTPHFKTTLKDEHGCESCHGPGAEHVAGGGDKTKIVRFTELSRQEASRRCLSCHGDQGEQAHFAKSAHASSEVGCIDCHSPHHSKDSQYIMVKSQPELCYGCHTGTKADFAKPYRHRVNEGLVQCTDCHNVHGTTSLRSLRNSAGADAVCFKCHADKRGPFAYEHMPVKTEGCSSCHTPHGSTNPRFLRVSQVNLLCLQCHTQPAASPMGPAHNLSQKYQACTMCHPAIHGSNTNVALMK